MAGMGKTILATLMLGHDTDLRNFCFKDRRYLLSEARSKTESRRKNSRSSLLDLQIFFTTIAKGFLRKEEF